MMWEDDIIYPRKASNVTVTTKFWKVAKFLQLVANSVNKRLKYLLQEHETIIWIQESGFRNQESWLCLFALDIANVVIIMDKTN